MKGASAFTYLARKAPARPNVQAEEQGPIRDLNVFMVAFDQAKEAEKHIGAGDPFFCEKCKVCLNKNSKLMNKAEYQKTFLEKKGLSMIAEEVEKPVFSSSMEVEKPSPKKQAALVKPPSTLLTLSPNDTAWICQFCDHHNKLRIQKQQIPTVQDLVYIIESASHKQLKQSTTDSTIVFCIDNSGSMNTTLEVKGKVNLKHGINQAEIDFLRQFMEPGDQAQLNYIVGQSKACTYVSRKQCVMAAIENQINGIKEGDPNKKVGLVTFNNEVVVYGDCKKDPVHIVGDKLYKFNDIVEDVVPLKVEEPLRTSYEQILHNLEKTEASGATALGPAVVASIELASKGSPGSTVMICTDGLANIGLGNLDISKEASQEFYGQLALKAKAQNLIINVITMKGEACDVESLSQLVRETNGNLLVVNPEDITKKFANILKDEIVALNATVKIRLHKSLKFRNELPENIKQGGLILQKQVGNATVNSKVSFQYELRDDQQLNLLGINPQSLSTLPFQAQITYTSLSGHRLVRVVTSTSKATTNSKFIHHNVDLPVVHARMAQQKAAYTKLGAGDRIESYNKGWMEYIKKDVKLEEHQKVKNQKFEKISNRAEKAYKNKEVRSKPEMKGKLKKKEERASEDMDDDVMLRFEMGKNYEEEEEE